MLFKKFTFLMSMMVFLSSCGDLFTKEEKEKEYNQFAICELDAQAITKVLTEKIKGDLKCLENNLYVFVNVVESDKPGYLHKASLMTYIEENMEEADERTTDILSAVFDLNSLIFGGDSDYMSRENIGKLSKLIISINEIMTESPIYEYFSVEKQISFQEHNKRKAKVFNAFYKIGYLINENINLNNNKIDLNVFLDYFKNFENKDIIRYSKALLFVKKFLLGGDKNSLNSRELSRLMSMFGDLGKVVFDFVDLPDTTALSVDEEEEILKILKEDIDSTYKNFYYKNKPTEVVFTYQDIKEMMEIFFPDFIKYINYKKTVLKIKEVLLGSASEGFTGDEIRTLLKDILYQNFSKGVFVYRSFSIENQILAAGTEIAVKIENLLTFDDNEESFVQDFNRILQTYRFYKGSEFANILGIDYQRNPRGIFDIMLYEDLLGRFFQHYGDQKVDAVGDYVINQAQLVNFMGDFTEFFEGEGYVLPGRSADTAETITLMTTLFHFQSNGDGIIEIPEFTEFINTMTSALNLSHEMSQYLKRICDTDNKGRVHPTCYRDNFLDFLEHEIENGKVVGDYVPGIRQFYEDIIAEDPLQGVNAPEVMEGYLIDTGIFSRYCYFYKDGSEIPMSKGDFIVSWAGLLIIEQAILRFDADDTNILEEAEVSEVFEVYQSAVKGLLPDVVKKLPEDGQTSLAKFFFNYLIRYKKVPEIEDAEAEWKDLYHWKSWWYGKNKKTLKTWWGNLKEGGHVAGYALGNTFRPVLNGAIRVVNYLPWVNIKPRRKRQLVADRFTFASILKIISSNSPSRTVNPFNCDKLR